MMKRLSIASRFALCLAAVSLFVGIPAMATAADSPNTAAGPAVTSLAADTAASEAPVTGLTPEQIQALQEGTGADTTGDDNKSTFDKVSDFVTDNAPWFIIGIVVLAAIIAGILIMRGRRKDRAPGTPGRDGPASVPSASEIRRRKRAAMQRSREEERLRRKAHMEGRRLADPNSPLPLSARVPADQAATYAQPDTGPPLDPVEAEKQSARSEVAAAAVARSGGAVAPPSTGTGGPVGAVPPPAAPSQTAPTPGVVTPGSKPDTVYASAGAAAAGEPPAESPVADPDQPTVVNELPDDPPEPPLEAPGLDARVGEAAAAFAGGAAGGALAAKAASGEKAPDEIEGAEASAEEQDAEQRLRAKVAEIRAEQGRVPAAAPDVEDSLGAEQPSLEEDLEEAESIQRELDESEVVAPTPSGLAGIEQKLQASSDERDRTLANAEERLQRIEQRAADAEKRAAFAERLAQLKIDESARERRMNEVMSGIDRAEERAREAEERAKSAEQVASAALEDSDDRPASGTHKTETPEPPEEPRSWQPPAARAPEAPAEPTPPQPEELAAPAKSPLFGSGLPGGSGSSGSLNLNTATFEELRDADLSVTQATRILAYRERFGGYHSVDDLEKVPGFPAELIESLKGKATV